ncbi:MAG: translation elongation factor Ts [Candidatus Portnoybacteria bacterium]|nr:translation elongation factor Ts [Candidatus Portnoybacteria bacterium]MDD4982969.1 translation elongation factor Ts [Candidatus Portnoybacteria bacterium]
MVLSEQVKKLREATGASMMDCKKALEEAQGDETRARELLSKRGAEMAEKKSERQTKSGIVNAYVHANQRIGVLLELYCETDFVARNENFKNLAHEICLHIAAVAPQSNEELLSQPFIKDPAKTVQNIITDAVGKLGENIKLGKFSRFEI